MGRRLACATFSAALGCCSGAEDAGQPRLGTLQAAYRLERLTEPDRLGWVAVLERPDEARIYLVASSLDEDWVKQIATGDGTVGASLEPSDRLLLEHVSRAELAVVDANGDGNDDLLVRERWSSRNDPLELGYWRERVWLLTDLHEPAKLLVDVVAPGGLDSPVGPSLWPVSGGLGNHGIFALGRYAPRGLQAYAIGFPLLAADVPCTAEECLPLIVAGEERALSTDLAARTLAGGSLAVAYVTVRVTGHLKSEWYLARTRCTGSPRALECSTPEDWGLARKAVGFSFLPDPDARSFVRVSGAETETDGGIEAWTGPGSVVAADLADRFLPWTCRSTGERSWRLIGTSGTPRSIVARDLTPSGTALAGVYELPGWSEPYLHRVASNIDRGRAFELVWSYDVDHADIVELPR